MRTFRLLLVSVWCLITCSVGATQLPPPPEPPENPITEAKRVLGKILFWEEQLSSDNTMACGTCHEPLSAGADIRIGRNPGFDGLFNTLDDVLGSPGVIKCDEEGNYLPHEFFNLQRQVTGRSAPAYIGAQYAPLLFWDGRADTTFIDPQTGEISIKEGGALESQAVGPVVSNAEMAHDVRNWDQVVEKLRISHPMALASELPPDMNAAINNHDSYPKLYEWAFGDSEITSERTAFAIASYERTLIPDLTPWDRFMQGDVNAMTRSQRRGFSVFEETACVECHTPPFFTDDSFRNIGLRPWQEDTGRMGITEDFEDRGKFKIPSLRNVGLKNRFMHNGQIRNIGGVINFYLDSGRQFQDNQDPLIREINVPPDLRDELVDFLVNGLTDPRTATEAFPFDRPTLYSQVTPRNPLITGTSIPGTGGFRPRMIAVCPPVIGDAGFKVGLSRALGGAHAYIGISSAPPVDGAILPDEVIGPIMLPGNEAGRGFATFRWPIPDDPALIDQKVYMQWFINDPNAESGQSRSRAAELTYVCNTCDSAAELATIRIINGEILIGDINDLMFSDDDALTVRSGFGETLGDIHNMEIRIVAYADISQPSTINVRIESSIDQPSGIARVSIRNWETNEFDNLGQYQIGEVEQVNQFEGINGSEHVRNDGRIVLVVKHVVFIPFVAFSFESYLDQVLFTVEP